MNEPTQFTIGSDVSCTDGGCGQLRRVVVDPIARTLTYLVVEAKHRQGEGRLVPIALATCSDAEIQLSCTIAQFDNFERSEETRFLPGAQGQWSYGQGSNDLPCLLWARHGRRRVGNGRYRAGRKRCRFPADHL